ncbi:MAG TPA: HAMP domain-containing sensor histidine kinase [Myxococcaceae bacterium]|nr:HAMP domain-containing sensor histidine kinase [Myxococcaceae bacterium]
MKLRPRLVLTTLAAGLPLVATMGWVQSRAEERAAVEALSQFLVSMMMNGGRAACEQSPQAWSRAFRLPPRGPRPPGPPPPPPRAFAYDRQGTSTDPDAPPLSPALLDQLAGKSMAREASPGPRGSAADVLLAMPWAEGPCALVLIRRPLLPMEGAVRVFTPALELWLPPAAMLVVGLLIAMGPVVRRLRALRAKVLESAKAGYQAEIGVGGADEIGDLGRAFDEAGREVRAQMEAQQRRERTLREFLENTTHDVMIPLTVLQGHLAALVERSAKSEPADGATLNGAVQEAHYMASLVHNLATAAKLEAGEPALQRHPVDLGEVLKRAVARHQPVARRSEVSLEMAVPPEPVVVAGDVTLVEQALSNVIYNAVRYNKAGGHLAAVLERTARGFSVRVIDDGPGIPEEERSRLLERYFRGNAARTRAPEGRGLGLAIAFRVAELHGWTLKLDRSEPGGLQVELVG